MRWSWDDNQFIEAESKSLVCRLGSVHKVGEVGRIFVLLVASFWVEILFGNWTRLDMKKNECIYHIFLCLTRS